MAMDNLKRTCSVIKKVKILIYFDIHSLIEVEVSLGSIVQSVILIDELKYHKDRVHQEINYMTR